MNFSNELEADLMNKLMDECIALCPTKRRVIQWETGNVHIIHVVFIPKNASDWIFTSDGRIAGITTALGRQLRGYIDSGHWTTRFCSRPDYELAFIYTNKTPKVVVAAVVPEPPPKRARDDQPDAS